MSLTPAAGRAGAFYQLARWASPDSGPGGSRSGLGQTTKRGAMPRLAEDLIRLTPSAVRQVLAVRRQWGWRPGLSVLIVRKDDDFAFTVPGPGVGPSATFMS